jgi:hypothetical protein
MSQINLIIKDYMNNLIINRTCIQINLIKDNYMGECKEKNDIQRLILNLWQNNVPCKKINNIKQ